ncbi:MAG: hypothetical protein AAFZ01_07995 [Pseudomonadota bacterium]
MKNPDIPRMNGATQPTGGGEPQDEMEQVRQLLLGEQHTAQSRAIEALEARVETLEALVHALATQGQVARDAWARDVAPLLDPEKTETKTGKPTRSAVSQRAVAQQITPLSPPRKS